MHDASPIHLPLKGVRVLEFEGIGPGPLAGSFLAGLGAHVTLVERPVATRQPKAAVPNPLRDGKVVVPLDLKNPAGLQAALDLVATHDVLIEGLRPGVMERLGLGPADCAQRNPRLVYGRMTGWGQHGPLAQTAGHDLNYVALTGLLSLSARDGERPIVPPTLVGDATGALGLALGIVCGVLDVRAGGHGRVVDAAIVDIAAMLGRLLQWLRARGQVENEAPSMFHDSPFYDVYTCSDGKHVSVAALEPQFYAILIDKLGLHDVDLSEQNQRALWPALKQRFADTFRGQPRQHWCDLLEGTDACFAPVLSLREAAEHPHNMERGTYADAGAALIRPAPAPRFLELAAKP